MSIFWEKTIKRAVSFTETLQRFHRHIIFVNTFLGGTAVLIQTRLLIPWHDIISEDIEALEKKDRLLEAQVLSLEKTDEIFLHKVEELIALSNVRNKLNEKPWYRKYF
jgi:hypothetical protein